jgi:hypothetical protein
MPTTYNEEARKLADGTYVGSVYGYFFTDFRAAYNDTSPSYPDELRRMFAAQRVQSTLDQYGVSDPEQLKQFKTATTPTGVIAIFNPDGSVRSQRYDALLDTRGAEFKDFVKSAAMIGMMAFPGVGQAIGASITSAAGYAGASAALNAAIGSVVVNTALSGGDVKNAV